MNIKTKAIGLLAGSALAMSLATGAMAQADTEAILADTNCAGAVEGADGELTFGTFTWDGTAYVGTPTPGEMTVTITAGPPNPSTTCDVTLTVSDLIGVDDEGVLPSGAISLSSDDAGSNPFTVGPSDSVTVTATFNPNYAGVAELGPDTYEGTITVGSAVGS